METQKGQELKEQYLKEDKYRIPDQEYYPVLKVLIYYLLVSMLLLKSPTFSFLVPYVSPIFVSLFSLMFLNLMIICLDKSKPPFVYHKRFSFLKKSNPSLLFFHPSSDFLIRNKTSGWFSTHNLHRITKLPGSLMLYQLQCQNCSASPRAHKGTYLTVNRMRIYQATLFKIKSSINHLNCVPCPIQKWFFTSVV